LKLYEITHISEIAASTVQWFGALVILMGWVETRAWGLMPRYCVEAWLIADILYTIVFYDFVQKYAVWNIFTLHFSILFPIIYAPIRVYWLWFAPLSIQPK